jgi:hypothetical protein
MQPILNHRSGLCGAPGKGGRAESSPRMHPIRSCCGDASDTTRRRRTPRDTMARGKEKAELVGEAAKQKVTAHGGPGGDESNAFAGRTIYMHR